MMRFLKGKLIAASLGFALIGSAASAVTVFADDFNRENSTTVGNGWSELASTDSAVQVRSNRLWLRDSLAGEPDAAVSSTVIDVVGLHSVALSFSWRALQRNESDDVLNVAWAAGRPPAISDTDQWTSLGQFASDGHNIFSETLSLGAAANNQIISLLFWTDVSEGDQGTHEGFHIDNIVVSAVPVPAGAPLLLAGLAGLGFARRRRKAPEA